MKQEQITIERKIAKFSVGIIIGISLWYLTLGVLLILN